MGDMREAGAAAIRSGLPISRYPQINQTGIGLAQLLPAQTPFLHGAWPEVLDQHIGFLDQPQEQLHPFLLAQVNRDRFLVAGFAEPGQGRVMALGGRPEAPHRIAGDGVLDLEYFSAKLAQNRRRVRTGQEGSQIDDPDAAHRQLRFQGCSWEGVSRSEFSGIPVFVWHSRWSDYSGIVSSTYSFSDGFNRSQADFAPSFPVMGHLLSGEGNHEN
jgi:hypothetical protein